MVILYTSLCLFFLSFCCSVALNFILLRLSHQKKWYDYPDIIGENLNPRARRVHTVPKPKVGGVAIVGTIGLMFLVMNVPLTLLFIYFVSIFVFLTGLMDDFRNLKATTRLFIQFAVGLVVAAVCNIGLQRIYLTTHHLIHLHYLTGIFLASFIIVGAINATNMIDGLDGLAGGLCLLAFLFFCVHSYLSTGSVRFAMVFGVPVIGALAGFLLFNFHPSKIFMGDSGSNWMGFMLGIFILLIQKSYVVLLPTILKFVRVPIVETFSLRPKPSLFINLVLCFSIPILDTFYLILTRSLERKNPLRADNRHLHHTLLKMGFNHRDVMLLLVSSAAIFGLLSLNCQMSPFLGRTVLPYVFFVMPLWLWVWMRWRVVV